MNNHMIFAVGRENEHLVRGHVVIEAHTITPDMIKLLIAQLQVTIEAITPEQENSQDTTPPAEATPFTRGYYKTTCGMNAFVEQFNEDSELLDGKLEFAIGWRDWTWEPDGTGYDKNYHLVASTWQPGNPPPAEATAE